MAIYGNNCYHFGFLTLNKMDLQIIYSLFTDSIKKQLKNNGLNFDKQEVKIIQELSFANMNLKFHEIISDTEADEIHKTIHKRLVDHIDKHNVDQAE